MGRYTRGRHYPKHTPLGRIMDARGVLVQELAYEAKVSPRTMTDYLAARKDLRRNLGHLTRLADCLDVDPDELVGEGSFDPDLVTEWTR